MRMASLRDAPGAPRIRTAFESRDRLSRSARGSIDAGLATRFGAWRVVLFSIAGIESAVDRGAFGT